MCSPDGQRKTLGVQTSREYDIESSMLCRFLQVLTFKGNHFLRIEQLII